MNRKLYLLAVVLFVSFVSLTSCSETEAVDKYANWSERNVEYLDFIASQATQDLKVNKAGKIDESLEVGDWRRIQDWRHFGDDSFKSVNDYVYIHVNKVGEGTVLPVYTDSVYVDYRGVLINGVVFDSSYDIKNAESEITLFPDKPDGEYGDVYKHVVYIPNPLFTIPAKFELGGKGSMRIGWVTAMQQMHVGDCWTLYLPANLGYGESGYGDIPGNSVLIFDVTLNKILDSEGKVIDAIKAEE